MQANMVSAINNALELLLKENDKVIVFGEDVGKDGGVFRVTDGLQAKFGSDRVFDTPLAESVIMGSSIGMAMSGLRPIPEMQFAGFMFLAFSQLVNHAARFRSRTRSNLKVPMVVRTPVSGGVRTLGAPLRKPRGSVFAHRGPDSRGAIKPIRCEGPSDKGGAHG